MIKWQLLYNLYFYARNKGDAEWHVIIYTDKQYINRMKQNPAQQGSSANDHKLQYEEVPADLQVIV